MNWRNQICTKIYSRKLQLQTTYKLPIPINYNFSLETVTNNFSGNSFFPYEWYVWKEFYVFWVKDDGEFIICLENLNALIFILFCYTYVINDCLTARKVSVFGVILVRIFRHSVWIRRDTECLSQLKTLLPNRKLAWMF